MLEVYRGLPSSSYEVHSYVSIGFACRDVATTVLLIMKRSERISYYLSMNLLFVIGPVVALLYFCCCSS